MSSGTESRFFILEQKPHISRSLPGGSSVIAEGDTLEETLEQLEAKVGRRPSDDEPRENGEARRKARANGHSGGDD